MNLFDKKLKEKFDGKICWKKNILVFFVRTFHVSGSMVEFWPSVFSSESINSWRFSAAEKRIFVWSKRFFRIELVISFGYLSRIVWICSMAEFASCSVWKLEISWTRSRSIWFPSTIIRERKSSVKGSRSRRFFACWICFRFPNWIRSLNEKSTCLLIKLVDREFVDAERRNSSVLAFFPFLSLVFDEERNVWRKTSSNTTGRLPSSSLTSRSKMKKQEQKRIQLYLLPLCLCLSFLLPLRAD